ncbi:MAG: SAM-dependent methyltransferase [Bacteroidetes bacterium]|nr:MAG: SAM-dependent methyltransferase [Bacteroidota bacterium]
MKHGTLYLIPSLLGDTDPEDVLPRKVLEIIHSLNTFIVEEIRNARRFLRKAGFAGNFEKTRFLIFNEHSRRDDLSLFITPLLQGTDTGLISEAGTPCIADPGAEIVEIARQSGIRVVPLTGPSSILLALMASGFNGQNFAFHGYLPIDRKDRQRRIRELERSAVERDQTQLFIETPYRNKALFEALIQTCQPSTRLCIAMDLTLESESIDVCTIKEWRSMHAQLPKKPAIFLLYR